MPIFDKEPERFVWEKCGFETSSAEIFPLHKKNCPRIRRVASNTGTMKAAGLK